MRRTTSRPVRLVIRLMTRRIRPSIAIARSAIPVPSLSALSSSSAIVEARVEVVP